MKTTTNHKEMYTEEEFLSRISYLNRLYEKLTPEQRNVTKQFMAENGMAAVGEMLDYLQELGNNSWPKMTWRLWAKRWNTFKN